MKQVFSDFVRMEWYSMEAIYRRHHASHRDFRYGETCCISWRSHWAIFHLKTGETTH